MKNSSDAEITKVKASGPTREEVWHEVFELMAHKGPTIAHCRADAVVRRLFPQEQEGNSEDGMGREDE